MSEMKATVKFEIGDMVVLATELAAAKVGRELGERVNLMFPHQVMERRLQECHGGVNQVHYTLVGQTALIPELGLASYAEYTEVLGGNRDDMTALIATFKDQVENLMQDVAALKADR